jgi:hypothetical protein
LKRFGGQNGGDDRNIVVRTMLAVVVVRGNLVLLSVALARVVYVWKKSEMGKLIPPSLLRSLVR